jgi:phage host-nuclease inhibitor protein Gam
MAKTKKATIANVTLEQAQEASEHYSQLSDKLIRIEGKMNEEINKVKSKYKDEITELQEQIEVPVEVLEVFAKEQQPSWGKKKSFELLHTVIGFRTGTPKVDKSKKFTWDGITELLVKNGKKFSDFVRTKTEINKEAILALKDEQLLRELKDECYIEVVQTETFYVEAKREEIPA